MALTWAQRYERLQTLLSFSTHGNDQDESSDFDVLGKALDCHFESQKLGGRSSKAAEIENLRFSSRDIVVQGTLAAGQFGVIDVVRCQLNQGIYVRKTIKKNVASRFKEQCLVQFERELLSRATEGCSVWAPHLLCAYQTPNDLHLVMEYAEGGSLADVLNSAPQGRLAPLDLEWWMPQAIAAISWCHSQNFAHRDIKPENFVLTATAHLKLIDFGCAAPLLSADRFGVQLVPKQYCLVPCGTCDYIAPEILQFHEEALVAAESGETIDVSSVTNGYGCEVDWWSFGAMMYELACGVAPFFARDVAQTYLKIIEHERHTLSFQNVTELSLECRDFIRRLLSRYDVRLGRRHTSELQQHPYLKRIKWTNLHLKSAPPSLVVPRFNYANTAPAPLSNNTFSPDENSLEQPFAFSAFFQSSPGLSNVEATPQVRPPNRGESLGAFVGFTWGPSPNAFHHATPMGNQGQADVSASHPSNRRASLLVPNSLDQTPLGIRRPLNQHHMSDPAPAFPRFSTPIRPTPIHSRTTIPRAGESVTSRRIRNVSDREALRMMLDCVGVSARKRVWESGRKPKSLMADEFPRIPSLHLPELLRRQPSKTLLNDSPATASSLSIASTSNSASGSSDDQSSKKQRKDVPPQLRVQALATSISTTSSSPPPSPSPRPGSAMSRRSATPGLTTTFRSISLGVDSSALKTGRSRDWTPEFPKAGPLGERSAPSPSITRLLPSPSYISTQHALLPPSPSPTPPLLTSMNRILPSPSSSPSSSTSSPPLRFEPKAGDNRERPPSPSPSPIVQRPARAEDTQRLKMRAKQKATNTGMESSRSGGSRINKKGGSAKISERDLRSQRPPDKKLAEMETRLHGLLGEIDGLDSRILDSLAKLRQNT